jgi:hypothetical protein
VLHNRTGYLRLKTVLHTRVQQSNQYDGLVDTDTVINAQLGCSVPCPLKLHSIPTTAIPTTAEPCLQGVSPQGMHDSQATPSVIA